MKVTRWFGWCLCGMWVAAVLLLSCPPLQAQSHLAGTYTCVNIHIGKRTLSCSSPPLTLRLDGSYEIWGERGTYTVLGRYLVLSESKKRGPGRLERRGREIVFEYSYRGKKYTVTFRRRDSIPPGSAII